MIYFIPPDYTYIKVEIANCKSLYYILFSSQNGAHKEQLKEYNQKKASSFPKNRTSWAIWTSSCD